MSQKTTAKKKSACAPLKVVEPAPAPVPVPISAPQPHFTKFTHSIDTTGREMCVIRTNDLDELYELRERLLPKIVYAPEDQPARPSQPAAQSRGGDGQRKRGYGHEGDACPQCDGRLVRTTAVSQRTGEEYPLLVCSNAPECPFDAFVSKYPPKAKKGEAKRRGAPAGGFPPE